LIERLYKILFWTGYSAVLITAFIPLAGDLTKIKLGRGIFEIRLDHLLHFTAYFMICMYYLFGQRKGLTIFNIRPLKKFIVVTLVLATVTEFAQLWVPARAFNVMDWVANVAGILIGLIVIKIGETRLKSNR